MKKIMLLALVVASAATFMVPATASAELQSLHMSPTPAKLDISSVGGASLRTSLGTVSCNSFAGSATPEAGGTTGTLQLTFGADCTLAGGECVSTNPVEPPFYIATTTLPYHLVTLKGGFAGVLVTPANDAFAHFKCNTPIGYINVKVDGNGVLGTITAPECGKTSKTATLSFKSAASNTTQQHRQVAGVTEGIIWSLSSSGSAASLEAHGTLTGTNSSGVAIESTLVCT